LEVGDFFGTVKLSKVDQTEPDGGAEPSISLVFLALSEKVNEQRAISIECRIKLDQTGTRAPLGADLSLQIVHDHALIHEQR